MLNLQDVDEAYLKCKELVEQRLKETRLEIQSQKEKTLARMQEIHHNEQEIIKSGRTPTERMLEKTCFDTVEWRIITRMREKYLSDFYTESNKPEQVKVAKEQLQEILKVINSMTIINSLTIEELPEDV
jgi:hypothetical protein